MTERNRIKHLFEPRSVAVIGASSNSQKIGYKILDNILSGGYKGKIYPVNPKGGEIQGLKVYRSIDEVEDGVDVGVITIPSQYVFDSVKACADKGVKYLTIISSGFSEIGNVDEERKIVDYAKQKGTRIIGPNIFGIYAAKKSLNATFGPRIKEGNVAIVTQSGALGIAMIGKTVVENIGLSAMISVGNKADLDESELLEYLIQDEDSQIILFYIEGVHQGERLVNSLREATLQKPVVVIKSGRSKRGAMAAASHTGSLAGSDVVFDNIIRQCGVIRAESVQEALNWCKFLSTAHLPEGGNAVIVTNGGGIGVLATDASEKYHVDLYDDEKKLKEIFKDSTPDYGSTKNPVDLTGGARPEDYDRALDAALNHPDVHSVMSLYCETAVFDSESLIQMIENNSKKYQKKKKPLIFSVFGGETTEKAQEVLRKKNVPVFGDVYSTISCMGALYAYQRYISHPESDFEKVEIDCDFVKETLKKARKEKRTSLLPYEAQKIMKTLEVTVPQSRIAKSIEEAVSYSEEIGFPVVMKVVSKDILHKKDVGGVVLNLENKEEVMDAYQAIYHNCREHKPNAFIEGVEITEMVEAGTEIIIGAREDDSFGPVVMFGLGGSYVEVIKDVSFRSYPLSDKEITNMMKDTKAYPLLLGTRGEKKRDIEKVARAIKKLGALVYNCREDITDIEINPLMVYEKNKGIKAVDVRILLSKPVGGK